MPRKGHLFAVFSVFVYLKQKHNARKIYDPTNLKIDRKKFRASEEWEKFSGNVKEAILQMRHNQGQNQLVDGYFLIQTMLEIS
jgi:hypothetical protein